MDGNTIQLPVSTPPTPIDKKRFPKSFLLISIIFIFLLGYTLFWLNYFGIFKPSPQKQTSPYQKQIEQLDSVMKFVNAINKPLNPRVEEKTFGLSKGSINDYSLTAKQAFIRNDVKTARENLIKMKDGIINLGDPLQEKFISPAIKQKHDPKGKYIRKGESLDPRIMDLYFGIIDLLVATEKGY